MQPSWREWIQGHVEEILTAVLAAFFTALMFRVGMGMLFSIIGGLVIAYVIRLVAVPKAAQAIKRRLPGFNDANDHSL
ncbi:MULTISPECIES: hypothetical protein [Vreelandella]|uniref:AI-2E family transporter n=2 Tax=Vreelandella TaxID=3137766 RepID=A0A7C9P076_9GAMM|nr:MULTISPECIES: hypothetical protein [Halomonas]NDL69193.1 hypothetical protein [Halomonas alkaliphila]NYS44110.1 hypothetical protein [Halomonas zhaodongensis]